MNIDQDLLKREDELENRKYPKPTVDEPSLEQLESWLFDTGCDATDGCWIEHDGICEHGHPSWFLKLGLI